jgi:hypothetical protein
MFVARQPTLAFLLLVAMVTNRTGVVSVSLSTVEEFCVYMSVFNLRLPSNDASVKHVTIYLFVVLFNIILSSLVTSLCSSPPD